MSKFRLEDLEYSLFVTEDAKKDFKKHLKKNNKQREIVEKKLDEILKNPGVYGEPLGGNLKGKYSLHINSHFVLIYEIDEEEKLVRVLKYDKHDKAYGL
jgi:addiction module RelE/StbE family toxin